MTVVDGDGYTLTGTHRELDGVRGGSCTSSHGHTRLAVKSEADSGVFVYLLAGTFCLGVGHLDGQNFG